MEEMNEMGCVQGWRALCMEQSTSQREDHWEMLMSTMSPVLCATPQQGWLSQRSQLKLSVHQLTWTLEYSGYLMSDANN